MKLDPNDPRAGCVVAAIVVIAAVILMFWTHHIWPFA